MDNNRRRFTRVATENTAILLLDKQEISVEIKDISLKGLLIHEIAHIEMSPGLPLQLYWFLSEDFPALLMNAEVPWEKSPYVGVEFTNLPEETIEQLHRFLELNLGDEELFGRELEQLLTDNKSA